VTAQTLECEVLIVGGGPAGLSVAATLPDHVSTIIVHQDAEIGKPVRTSGGCWLDDVERLGIPSEFYQVMHQLDVYSDNKEAHFQVKDNKLVVLNITDLYQCSKIGSQATPTHAFNKILVDDKNGRWWLFIHDPVASHGNDTDQIKVYY